MAFFEEYFFEIVIVGLAVCAVLFTALGLLISSLAHKRRREQMEAAVYQVYLEEKAKKAAVAKPTPGETKITAKQSDTYTVALEVPEGDEIPAVSKDKEDEAAVSGVRISELADPPLCLGNVKDLETGRALLLSIGMKKVMPRPSGGLLSRMILIDEVPQLKYRNEMNPVYLLHPGAEYFSIGISIIASGPLTSYPITAGLRVSVKHLDGPWVDLPVTVDAVAAQRLDVSAIWDTKKFEGLFVDSKDPLPITIRTAFDGFPKPTSVEFTAKVEFASQRKMMPTEDELWKVPFDFITKAPKWAVDELTGMPIVIKFNVLQSV